MGCKQRLKEAEELNEEYFRFLKQLNRFYIVTYNVLYAVSGSNSIRIVTSHLILHFHFTVLFSLLRCLYRLKQFALIVAKQVVCTNFLLYG